MTFLLRVHRPQNPQGPSQKGSRRRLPPTLPDNGCPDGLPWLCRPHGRIDVMERHSTDCFSLGSRPFRCSSSCSWMRKFFCGVVRLFFFKPESFFLTPCIGRRRAPWDRMQPKILPIPPLCFGVPFPHISAFCSFWHGLESLAKRYPKTKSAFRMAFSVSFLALQAVMWPLMSLGCCHDVLHELSNKKGMTALYRGGLLVAAISFS